MIEIRLFCLFCVSQMTREYLRETSPEHPELTRPAASDAAALLQSGRMT